MDSIIPEYEVKELPSRFIGYPEGIKIFAKPYTFGTALNLQLVGRNNINTLSEILDGVRVEGMPKNLMTPQDVIFLGVYRNLMSSLHDKIDVKSICPKCLKENHVQKTLASIKFKPIDNFDKEVYPVEVELNNYTMWFTFLSYKDYEFCLQRYQGNKLYQLALQVIKYQKKGSDEFVEKPGYKLNTNNRTSTAVIEKYVTEVRNILFNMVDEDKETLDEVIDLFEDYGLKPIDVICSDENCKHKYSVNLEDENVLVTPFRNTEKLTRNRIKLRKSGDVELHRLEEDELEGSGATSGHDIETGSKTEVKQETVPVKKKEKEEQIKYINPENQEK
jgi:hypothetical protein